MKIKIVMGHGGDFKKWSSENWTNRSGGYTPGLPSPNSPVHVASNNDSIAIASYVFPHVPSMHNSICSLLRSRALRYNVYVPHGELFGIVYHT